ncbi:MAG: hypothetical protein LBE78_13085 [Burkholderiaceae bacterium]|nr:hypothetical protein [Burkholderiaceae bacterium]
MRKFQRGYRSPSARDGCRNCVHRSAEEIHFDGSPNRWAYECNSGKFFVSFGGICNHFRASNSAQKGDSHVS